MALQNAIALGIDAVAHCVKVDDAVPCIHEGLNAGMWSVGLALSGNEFGATAGVPPNGGGRDRAAPYGGRR